MTPEQRNDLCIEWDYTSNTAQQMILHEYNEKFATNLGWEKWEEFLIEKLKIRQFWQTVGLI